MDWRNTLLLGLGLSAAVWPAAARAATLHFPITMIVSNEDAENLPKNLLFFSAGVHRPAVVDLAGLTSTDVAGQTQLGGFVSVSADDELLTPAPVLLVDFNGNQKIDDAEPVFSWRPALSPQFKISNGRAVVHLQVPCACNGAQQACSTKQRYQISLVERASGGVLWGSEALTTVLHNDCSFTTVLGKAVAIPADVANRPYTELAVKVAANGCTHIVDLNQSLNQVSGKPGPPGTAGPQGAPGLPGATGEKGERGEKGEAGSAGPQGVAGAPGAPGNKGDKGDSGPIGPAGPQGPHGVQGATGTAGPAGEKGEKGVPGGPGPAGPKGDPGSQDIKFSVAEGGEQFHIAAPGFIESTYTAEYVGARFDGVEASVTNHTHHPERIVGPLPSCGAGGTPTLCRRGAHLLVDGKVYAAAPLFAGKVLESAVFDTLRLDINAGRWNDVGSFDETGKRIASLAGTYKSSDGLIRPVNADNSVKIRINGGKIQEWHESPTMANVPLFLEVRFTGDSHFLSFSHKVPGAEL